MITEVRMLVTTEYLPAAAVAISSFARHNRWFSGSINVYCPECERAEIAKALAVLNVRTVALNSDLLSRINQELPRTVKWVPQRFYSLLMLAEPATAAVLLLDADLLFTASVEYLQDLPSEVAACPDGPSHAGLRTLRSTNEAHQVPASPDYIDRTFNAGLIRIAGHLLGGALFERAMSIVSRQKLERLKRQQHDQFVLNRLFENQWQEIGAEYNYLVKFASTVYAATAIRMSEARVLHFNGNPRPWQLDDSLSLTDPQQAKAIGLWLSAYAKLIADQSLGRARTVVA